MADILIVIVWIIASYLLGTVSFGDIVARIAGVDIRAHGTKNPGAANIYREIGPKYGIAVFALDVAKGAAATAPLLALDLPSWAPLAAALAVVLSWESPRPNGAFCPLSARFCPNPCPCRLCWSWC